MKDVSSPFAVTGGGFLLDLFRGGWGLLTIFSVYLRVCGVFVVSSPCGSCSRQLSFSKGKV
jgi:hypothetical protein